VDISTTPEFHHIEFEPTTTKRAALFQPTSLEVVEGGFECYLGSREKRSDASQVLG